jgi:cytidylate kinase
MAKSLLWIGGVHGVGKSTCIKDFYRREPGVVPVSLGSSFYHTAREMGLNWGDLEDYKDILKSKFNINLK